MDKTRKKFPSSWHKHKALNDYAGGKITMTMMNNRMVKIDKIDIEREWKKKSLIEKFFTLFLRGIWIRGTGTMPDF
jgi:hypothetical protein